MGIQVKTGVEFDRKLAELAWEHADSGIRSTVAHTLAMNITSRPDVMGIVGEKIVEGIVEKGIAAIYNSKPVETALEAARKSLAESIDADVRKLQTAITKDLAEESVGIKQKVAETATAQLTQLFLRQLDIAQSPQLRVLAMNAVWNGVLEAAKQRTLEAEVSIDARYKQAICAALDAMKKPDNIEVE